MTGEVETGDRVWETVYPVGPHTVLRLIRNVLTYNEFRETLNGRIPVEYKLQHTFIEFWFAPQGREVRSVVPTPDYQRHHWINVARTDPPNIRVDRALTMP